jgi:hypothetical protein
VSSTRLTVDRYVVETLMPDLVGHDKQPSAFLVFLYLWSRTVTAPTTRKGRRGRWTTASLQQIAVDTGLSKSAVQQAVRTLKRRQLVRTQLTSPTSPPEYEVYAPWRRLTRAGGS